MRIDLRVSSVLLGMAAVFLSAGEAVLGAVAKEGQAARRLPERLVKVIVNRCSRS